MAERVYTSNSKPQIFNPVVSTSSYTVQNTDNLKWIRVDSDAQSNDVNINLPDVGITDGFSCVVENTGTYKLNFLVGATSTLQAVDVYTPARFRAVSLTYKAPGTWFAQGFLGQNYLDGLFDVTVPVGSTILDGSRLVYDATAQQWKASDGIEPFITPTQKTSSFSVDSSMHRKLVRITSSSPVTVTLPITTTEPNGLDIRFIREGTGLVTFACAGVTFSKGLTIPAQWGSATWTKLTTNSWSGQGDLL